MRKISWLEEAPCRGDADFIIEPVQNKPKTAAEIRKKANLNIKNPAKIKRALAKCATCPVFDECRADMLTWPFPPTGVVIAGFRPTKAAMLWHEQHPEWGRDAATLNERASRRRAKERANGNSNIDRVRSKR